MTSLTTWFYFSLYPQLISCYPSVFDAECNPYLVVVVVGSIDAWKSSFNRHCNSRPARGHERTQKKKQKKRESSHVKFFMFKVIFTVSMSEPAHNVAGNAAVLPRAHKHPVNW